METPTNILQSELDFLLELNEDLSENYTILKSHFKYCNVDFLLVNINNLYSCYCEYKEREYKNGFDKYDSYFIGKVKLENIRDYYNECIFVWDFRKSNENDFFWIKYDDNFFDKYELDYDCVNNSYRYKILNSDCQVGYDKFIEYYKSISNRKLTHNKNQ